MSATDEDLARLMRELEICDRFSRGLSKIFGAPVTCIAAHHGEDWDGLEDNARKAKGYPPKNRRLSPVRVLRPGDPDLE